MPSKPLIFTTRLTFGQSISSSRPINGRKWSPKEGPAAFLAEAPTDLEEEGIENTIARHSMLAEATRKGCEALGMKLFAPAEGRGSAVTPVWVPEGVDGKKIVSILKNKYGVTIAGGQDDYTGKIIRIGHLGYFGQFDIITTLAALEMTLAELGYEFERGAGIRAAETVFMEG